MGQPVSRRQKVYARQDPRAMTQPQSGNLLPIPAPIGGLNFRDTVLTMPPEDAVVLENVLCRTNKCELRGGWRQWVTGIADGSDETNVRTLMPYIAVSGSLDNKLFAAAGTDIFDVTDSDDAPVAAVTTTAVDGIWSSTMHSNTDDGSFLVAVNNGAGLYTYDTAAGWVQQTLTGGPANIDNITSVASSKGRLWFTFENDTAAYYLDVGAIAGALTAFDFGPFLTLGGTLRCVASWTQDSGQDIKDFFVIIGAQGNCLIYTGADPDDAATWMAVGNWDIGRVPVGTRFITRRGADLYVLTERGIRPLSTLINGQYDENADSPVTAKIQNALAPLIVRNLESFGWELQVAPHVQSLLILEPSAPTEVHRQWCMALATNAWSTFASIEMTCCAVLDGVFYFGRSDGIVGQAFETDFRSDGELLDGTEGGILQANIQPAFFAYGNSGRFKLFQAVKLVMFTPSVPAVSVRMNTNFNLNAAPGVPFFQPPDGAEWDESEWNDAYWSATPVTFETWAGLSGLGYYGSLAMRLRGLPGTAWSAAHVLYTIPVTNGMM